MKKNVPKSELFCNYIKKSLKIMRISFVLLFIVGILQVSAIETYAQKTHLSLSHKNAELISVLDNIEQASEFYFLYNEKLLDTHRKIDIDVNNTLISDVLDDLFHGTNINYTIVDKKIILAPEFVAEETILQQNRVTGTVTTSTGETLPGTTVAVKGTTIGVMTDMNGSFTIDVPNNQSILVFSFVGFETNEVVVGSQTRINVTLRESAIGLDEVVVTALGISREKKALSYNVQDVQGDVFTTARTSNVASSLSGRFSGVEATQVNSGAGGSSRVIIRGNTSLSTDANQQPLYVIDGMPINNENQGASSNATRLNVDRGDVISSMNPDDIESISVLKGGAAAALYGSQAANGVILITTKRGTAQKGVGVEISSDVSRGTPSIYPNYQYEYGQGQYGTYPANKAEGLSSGRLSYGAKIDGTMQYQFDGEQRPYSAVNIKDNIKSFYRPEVNMSNTVAFNAGNQNMQTRLSFSDTRTRNQTPNSHYNRKTVSMNSRATLGNNLVIIESSAQYNIIDAFNRATGGYAEMNPAWPIYLAANTVDVSNFRGPDPNKPGIGADGREQPWNPVPAAANPYYVAYQLRNEDNTHRFIGRVSVQVNLHPKVFIKGTAGKTFSSSYEFNYVPMTNAFTPLGYMESSRNLRDRTNFQFIANYSDKFFSDDIGLNLLVGAYQERDKAINTPEYGTEWIIPDFFSMTNLKNLQTVYTSSQKYRRESGTNSLFGEVNMDWRSIVYLTFSGRNDWFSVLNPDNNSIFYPAVGGSVILSQIIDLPTFFNFAKIRASWAQVGSATVTPGQIYQTYTISTNNAYGLPSLSNPSRLYNPDLVPVTSATTEFGFQVNFFNSRLGLDVNRYVKRTTDDQLSPPITGASGYQAGPMNVGLVVNSGWEISLTGTPIAKPNFSWDIAFNFGYNKNVIKRLTEGVEFIEVGTGSGGVQMISGVGVPYSTLRAWVLKKDGDGNQIYNATSRYEDREQVYLGTGVPPTNFGLNNNFRYKNFSLTVDFDSKIGHQGYNNWVQYANRFGLTKTTLPGRGEGLTLTGVDQQGNPYTTFWENKDLGTYYNNLGVNYSGSMSVFDLDFVKLRRMALRYEIPTKILRPLGIERASVAVTGTDLLIVYMDKKVKEYGFDPEIQESVGNAQGSSGVAPPKLRNFGFNVNIRF